MAVTPVTTGTTATDAVNQTANQATQNTNPGDFSASLADLKATYAEIEGQATELRTTVAVQSEILAAAKQNIQ